MYHIYQSEMFQIKPNISLFEYLVKVFKGKRGWVCVCVCVCALSYFIFFQQEID